MVREGYTQLLSHTRSLQWLDISARVLLPTACRASSCVCARTRAPGPCTLRFVITQSPRSRTSVSHQSACVATASRRTLSASASSGVRPEPTGLSLPCHSRLGQVNTRPTACSRKATAPDTPQLRAVHGPSLCSCKTRTETSEIFPRSSCHFDTLGFGRLWRALALGP